MTEPLKAAAIREAGGGYVRWDVLENAVATVASDPDNLWRQIRSYNERVEHARDHGRRDTFAEAMLAWLTAEWEASRGPIAIN